MTVQQDSYDETDDESSTIPDDLDPSEVDRPKTDDNQTTAGDAGADAGASAQEEDQNAFFRCESVKP